MCRRYVIPEKAIVYKHLSFLNFQVPIIVHNETEQAKVWSQIYSEGTEMQSVPVIKAWQLNERMYF